MRQNTFQQGQSSSAYQCRPQKSGERASVYRLSQDVFYERRPDQAYEVSAPEAKTQVQYLSKTIFPVM